jgi:3-dehydroquinate synthase
LTGKPSRQVGADLPYPVIVRPGALESVGEFVRRVAPAFRYAIITDSHVGPLYGSAVAESVGVQHDDVLAILAGEASKTRGSWGWLTDEMLSRNFGRDSAVIALGGGVVGDLAGFVAATYMRGIPVVHIPTTLLAMIDSAIGGKAGVDTPSGKNMVGSFHQPSGVLVDTQVLATLPLNELRTGFAEALKHGVIADEGYFDLVVKAIPEIVYSVADAGDSVSDLVVGSIEIKSAIVSRDEHEGGLRKLLNFGHTAGHAAEILSGFTISHGEAVAMGMVVEARIAELAGVAERGTAETIRNAVAGAGLPVELPSGMDAARMLEVMRTDKKVRGGTIQYSLPSTIGRMAGSGSGWTVSVADEIVREVLT